MNILENKSSTFILPPKHKNNHRPPRKLLSQSGLNAGLLKKNESVNKIITLIST